MKIRSFRVLFKIVKKKKKAARNLLTRRCQNDQIRLKPTNKVISKAERGIIFPTNLEATPEYFFPRGVNSHFSLTDFLIILACSAFTRQNGENPWRENLSSCISLRQVCHARSRISLFHRREKVVCPLFAIFPPIDFNATDFRR